MLFDNNVFMHYQVHSSVPVRCYATFGGAVSKRELLVRDSREITLRLKLHSFLDDTLAVTHLMAWCRQATSHFLSNSWSKPMSPCLITGLQLINITPVFDMLTTICSPLSQQLTSSINQVLSDSMTIILCYFRARNTDTLMLYMHRQVPFGGNHLTKLSDFVRKYSPYYRKLCFVYISHAYSVEKYLHGNIDLFNKSWFYPLVKITSFARSAHPCSSFNRSQAAVRSSLTEADKPAHCKPISLPSFTIDFKSSVSMVTAVPWCNHDSH